MADQQGTPTETELAWLAGFIEGEGSLALYAYGRKNGTAKIAVTIKIYNTDSKLIARCREIIRAMGIEPYLKEREQKPILKHDGSKLYKSIDPMLTLTVSKMSHARKMLNQISPYLVGDKKERANIMGEYLDKRFSRESLYHAPYSDDEVSLVHEFYSLTRNGATPAFDVR